MNYKTRNELSILIHQEQITQNNMDEVLALSNLHPSQNDFLFFVRNTLLWVGAISLIMSLLFFMAFNWNELGRFAKFLLVEAVMGTSILLYLFLDNYKKLQEVLLMLASIALGILLALIGQTYQTGADPWQLFAVWALLMTPWVVVAGFSGLWLLWIVLFNLGILLYFQKFDLSLFAIAEMHDNLLLLVFILNAMLWTVWEFLASKYKAFDSAISLKFLAFLTVASISTLVISRIYEYEHEAHQIYFVLHALCLGAMYYVYRIRQVNVYMMSLFALSLFLLALNLLFRVSAEYTDDFLGSIFFLLIAIGVMTTLIIAWLKHLAKEEN